MKSGCEFLKINSKDDTCLKVNGRSMKQVDVACYLDHHFNRQVKKESQRPKAPSSKCVPCAKG